MVRLVALALALAAAGPSSAQPRPSTTTMTCGQARQFIFARGAVVIGTGGQTYDRFVSDRSFCEPTQVTKTSFAPTRDNPQCFVGYRCIDPSATDWFGDF